MATEERNHDTLPSDSSGVSPLNSGDPPSRIPTATTLPTIVVSEGDNTGLGSSAPPSPSDDSGTPPPPRTNMDAVEEISIKRIDSGSLEQNSRTIVGRGAARPRDSGVAGSSSIAGPSKKRKEAKVVRISEDQSSMTGTVKEFGVNREIVRRIGAKMAKDVRVHHDGGEWAFEKILGDDEFMASGFLSIQPNGMKRIKNTKDNTYVFYIIEGAVAAYINHNNYMFYPGWAFQVPRGNNYAIQNMSDREAKLFFCQARPTTVSNERNYTSLLPSFDRPLSKVGMLMHWLLPRLIAEYLRLRKSASNWYRRNLGQYERLVSGRRLYLIFFLLGLMIRRLPFVGTLPLVNIQIVRVT